MSTSDLKKELYRRYLSIFQETQKFGYKPTRFLQMISSGEDIISVSQRLICSQVPSDGFAVLWENRRLDLSVECTVLEAKFRPLFDVQVLRAAYQRLEEYEYPDLQMIDKP